MHRAAAETDRQFRLSEAFGGAYEVTLIAATLFISESQFMLLDEPGRNLHGSLRKDLLDIIYQQGDKSVLIISHDVEILSAKRLNDVVYCKCLNANIGSNLVPLAGLASDQKMRNFMACPNFR
jgi:ABC-type Mn2+/Zn2+ transport system ATPase subunit